MWSLSRNKSWPTLYYVFLCFSLAYLLIMSFHSPQTLSILLYSRNHIHPFSSLHSLSSFIPKTLFTFSSFERCTGVGRVEWTDSSRHGTRSHDIRNYHRIPSRGSSCIAAAIGSRHPRHSHHHLNHHPPSKSSPSRVRSRCFNITRRRRENIEEEHWTVNEQKQSGRSQSIWRSRRWSRRTHNRAHFRWSHWGNHSPFGDVFLSWSDPSSIHHSLYTMHHFDTVKCNQHMANDTNFTPSHPSIYASTWISTHIKLTCSSYL